MINHEFASVFIIFENDDVIVISKPGGLLSIEDGFHPKLPNLRSMLRLKYGRIWTVHRLDKDTSGVILFSKNAESHRFLNSQFSNRQVKKTYQAVVRGFPIWDEKNVELPLRTNGDRKHRTVIDFAKGKKAFSQIKVIDKNHHFTNLEIKPSTGYTHQIRAHCAAVGLPILGDNLYFRGCEIEKSNEKISLYLHAYSIEIALSPEKNPQVFTTPPPKYFQNTQLKGFVYHNLC